MFHLKDEALRGVTFAEGKDYFSSMVYCLRE